MSELKNVVLVGAGGNLGTSVLKAFLQSSFNVTVLSRESSKSTFPAGVRVIHANYDSKDSLKAAFQGQDAVVLLVGGGALGDQQKFIDAAIAAGVKRFVPSEFGSDLEDPNVRKIVPVFETKYQTTEYLKSKESEMSWTAMVNGAFFDLGIRLGFFGLDPSSKTATLVDGGTVTFATTNLHQVGLATVKALEHSSETKNKHVQVSSFETSQKTVLAAIEKISGSTWKVNSITGTELQKQGNEKIKRGDFSGIVDLIKAAVIGDYVRSTSDIDTSWNERLGLKKDDFEESVKAALNGKLYGDD